MNMNYAKVMLHALGSLRLALTLRQKTMAQCRHLGDTDERSACC